eukprot:Pgem_evm1s18256
MHEVYTKMTVLNNYVPCESPFEASIYLALYHCYKFNTCIRGGWKVMKTDCNCQSYFFYPAFINVFTRSVNVSESYCSHVKRIVSMFQANDMLITTEEAKKFVYLNNTVYVDFGYSLYDNIQNTRFIDDKNISIDYFLNNKFNYKGIPHIGYSSNCLKCTKTLRSIQQVD